MISFFRVGRVVGDDECDVLVVDVFADEFDLVFNPCFIIESDGDDVDGFGMRGFRGSRKIEMHGMSQFFAFEIET